jgi:aryl-alcohol dehydrogenase-like predicted oxidoreductase
MQYRTLGRTGIKVSPYALGTLMFATQIGNPDPEQSIKIIHRALDAGINLVDTADSYGDSEETVGRALKGRRDTVVLATKVSRPMGADPNQQGASRRWIMTAIDNSLRRLQTDHIDLYQIQRPDPDTDIEETLSALTDLVRIGKIRAFGTSMMPAVGRSPHGRSAVAPRPSRAAHSTASAPVTLIGWSSTGTGRSPASARRRRAA